MTTNQEQAIWELCRQGLPLAADEAAERWTLGQTYQLQHRVRLAASIRELIDLCNWEVNRTGRAA